MTGTEPRRPATRGRLRPVPEPDRQPPHNLEAEEAVLGAILAAGRLLTEVAGLLEEADFYRPAHRTIWRAILHLTDRGQPIDPVTLLGELEQAGELADVGGDPFLHTLVEAVPTVANAGHYAQLVAETARRRRVIDLGIRLAHSDANPAVLTHLAGELADTRTAAPGERRWEPPIPFGAAGEVPGFPVEGAAGLARGVCGRGRHRHPNPSGSGWHARPRRAGHRRRRHRRGPTPARLARAAVPVRGRGHGRRDS
jgi:hypothetical protein